MTGARTPDFRGTKRFRIIRSLGIGGMGMVYEAHDRERDCRVALKTVRELAGEDLLRLKNEFRALQDLSHPNLVSLGELCEEGGRLFFTMELIDGVSFLAYVRRGGAAPDSAEARPSTADRSRDEALAAAATWRDSPARQLWEAALSSGPRFDETRLRAAFGQLVQALAAVHAAGKVHRDVKPTNVLVTGQGRVVLLDFGLVTPAVVTDQSRAGHAVGTAEYMAPEQAASQNVGPAADCYSAGVLLYEALTSQLPFLGAPLEIMLKKQRSDPPRASSVCAGVPPELDALAAGLLHFDPLARPTARDVLARLGLLEAADPAGAIASASCTQAPPFVGRATELEALGQAFVTSRQGEAVAVLVGGESGVGKSALVRQFTARLAPRGVVVLAGRCYEREAVPYKAVDGVIDALSRYLARLPDEEAAALVPRSASLLGEAFPVLRRVKAVAKAPRSTALQQLAPLELRSRLFGAMRELFGRLADWRPLVVVVDDLQWGDADSLALLGEVLRPPEAPAMLVVATVRLGMTAGLPDFSRHMPADVRRMNLGRLPPQDAQELATRLLERLAPASTVTAEAIATEAGGHPLFIDELVRHLGLHGEVSAGPLRLDDALRLRVAALETGARRILELVAVAGRPVTNDVVRRAAALDQEPYARQVGVLRVSSFVHGSGARGSNTLSPYHDRVRESVVAQLSADQRRACHEQLAVALEQSERPDPDVLAVHWREAGDERRAADYSERAAAVAEAAFAFDRAALLYRTVLELRPPDHPSRRALFVKLGGTLAKAGRGGEAAAAYLGATAGADPAEAIDLRQLAAVELLKSGHLDEGLSMIHQFADATGMRLASTPRGALAALVLRRALVRLRGYGFRLRAESQVSPEQLRRIDFYSWVAMALGAVDTIRANDVNARALLKALAVGEPNRLLLALGTEAVYVSLAGAKAARRTTRLMDAVRGLPAERDLPSTRMWLALMAGCTEYYLGRLRSAHEKLAEAERIIKDECVGTVWELDTTSMFLLWTLTHLGRIAELSRRAPKLVAEALDRGDLYAATNLRLSVQNVAWLVGDDVEDARRTALEAVACASAAGPLVRTWFTPTALCQLDLYAGAGADAHARLERGWGELERSLILRVQLVRVEAHQLRGRCAVAAAQGDRARAPALLREAERDAQRVRRERMRWSDPFADLLLAGVAAMRGDLEAAVQRCAAAATGFDIADMALYAAAARRRQGELVGGDEGRALVAAADAWMRGEKIKSPARWTAMLAPGFAD